MDDEIETLMIEVRASTSGFRSDIETMRSAMDTTLVDGFEKAGNVLERSLLSAIRRGKLGFDELKSIALSTMNEVAAQAIQSGIGSLFGGSSPVGGGTSIGSLLNGLFGSLMGLPGRATGGPVSPGSAYLVGERGPEVFVPTSAGRVENGMGGNGGRRDVHVAINLAAPRGTEGPIMLRRSSRQVASAVARAMREG
ncbi:phage tail tape measure protein [Aurantiacibacter marinus]|uniref:Tail tape measure protein n=1 Tax=Aurantiacibacter marinus TaxID=874156 RepID=A0A0H0XX48_9SPHN|nr:phage tail tape measure protein [Aurantiacibacter marinus]KLI64855.1 tail tape measure protein [Aurantiacibacter marinus]